MKSLNVKIVYDNPKDRELVELIDTNLPIFIDFIDFNSKDGKKEAYRIKSHWAARLNPFIQIEDEEQNIIQVFYSENGSAINQLISYLNDSSKV